jgi:hypothetical protein
MSVRLMIRRFIASFFYLAEPDLGVEEPRSLKITVDPGDTIHGPSAGEIAQHVSHLASLRPLLRINVARVVLRWTLFATRARPIACERRAQPRYQTIVTAFDWKSQLFSKEWANFRRLTIFVGGLEHDSVPPAYAG